jgi:hypothetical protein
LQPYIWGWNPLAEPVLDPYQAFMVESMHQIDLGMFTHVRERLVKFYRKEGQLQKLRELDDRIKFVRQECRIQHLPLPSSTYFVDAANLTAAEHRAVFELIVAISSNLLSDDHVELLRILMDWHKLVSQVEFNEDHFGAMQRKAIV